MFISHSVCLKSLFSFWSSSSFFISSILSKSGLNFFNSVVLLKRIMSIFLRIEFIIPVFSILCSILLRRDDTCFISSLFNFFEIIFSSIFLSSLLCSSRISVQSFSSFMIFSHFASSSLIVLTRFFISSRVTRIQSS